LSDTFRLLDLRSQAAAVQRLLAGRTSQEKRAWLAAHGGLSQLPTTVPNAPATYRFVSPVGIECVFFVDGDEFVFVGDHTTFTVSE
jgi:hypothetical protein